MDAKAFSVILDLMQLMSSSVSTDIKPCTARTHTHRRASKSEDEHRKAFGRGLEVEGQRLPSRNFFSEQPLSVVKRKSISRVLFVVPKL